MKQRIITITFLLFAGISCFSQSIEKFKVDFEIQFNIAPKSIKTYVWNQDPEGSRGTETVVQSGG